MMFQEREHKTCVVPWGWTCAKGKGSPHIQPRWGMWLVLSGGGEVSAFQRLATWSLLVLRAH